MSEVRWSGDPELLHACYIDQRSELSTPLSSLLSSPAVETMPSLPLGGAPESDRESEVDQQQEAIDQPKRPECRKRAPRTVTFEEPEGQDNRGSLPSKSHSKKMKKSLEGDLKAAILTLNHGKILQRDGEP